VTAKMKFLDINSVRPFPGIMLRGAPTQEQIDRYQELSLLFPQTKGVSTIPVGRQNAQGEVEIASHCDVLVVFQHLARQDSQFQHIPVILGNYTDEEMVKIHQSTHPVLAPVEALVEQGRVLESHRALENATLSGFVKTLRSKGFTKQYTNSLIAIAQSPSWLHGAIQTYPKLKSVPSKLLPFSPYKDFVEAFWSCLKNSLSSNPETARMLTIRQFNQLLAFFKLMLLQGQEQEACHILSTTSIQDLVEQNSSTSNSTCDELGGNDSGQQSKDRPDIARYRQLQKVRQFHYTRLTRKGFSPLNEARARYWNLIISPLGNIKPSFISSMSERGIYNPQKLQQYLDQISEFKELESDFLTLSDIAPNNPYAESSELQLKSPSSLVGYNAKRNGPHKAQVSLDSPGQLKREELWSTLQAAIEDLNIINEIEIKGLAPGLASSLGLNVSRGKVFWYPSLPIHLPPLPTEGAVHPAFLICTSQDETLLTPHTSGKILGFVPLESGPPAIECQFPDKNRILPLKSVLLHPKDQLKIEQPSQNR
jgi:hypothetical protein